MRIRTVLIGGAVAAATFVPALAASATTSVCVEDPTQSRPPLAEACVNCPGPITVNVHGVRKTASCQLPL